MTLYNKYRPRKFSQLIGSRQKEAARWLISKVKKNESLPATFISGPTGSGKTTLAGLLTAALRCDNTKAGEPCGACGECIKALERCELDVIDGSVDTGIESVRTFLRSLWNRPLDQKRRVIIFDEMHNLSKKAQEALLRTVENPPAWVSFVFCTTDLQLVADALVNRCLPIKIDMPFRPDVLDHLSSIALKEGHNYRAQQIDEAIGAYSSLREAINKLEILLSGGEPPKDSGAELEIDPKKALAKLFVRGFQKKDSREVVSLLRKLRYENGTRAFLIEYLHSCVLNELSSKKVDKAKLLGWVSAIEVLGERDVNSLPALFTVDILNIFKSQISGVK